MKIIRSSEIASYLFCPVSWWIGRKKGVKRTAEMVVGARYHKTVSENQSKANFLYVSMVILVVIIIFLLIYWLLTWL